jgi:uncharacterized membrane protein (UPF0127 family)
MINKLQVVIVLILIPLGGLYLYAKNQNIPMREVFSPGTPYVHIDEIPMPVEIVDSPLERERGLSGRDEIGTNGMLFVFDESDYHGIWMKDMRFSIDIIWIDEKSKVIAIDQGVRPDTYPRTFRPPTPVRYVIETAENYTSTFGITVGDEVRLPVRLR